MGLAIMVLDMSQIDLLFHIHLFARQSIFEQPSTINVQCISFASTYVFITHIWGLFVPEE